ncbi:DUF1444 family protein [Paenibacillus albus]|uniref:DUF1444 family protein n=1 Tax=Paenibacillus albus TaxID=2495582 RepID=A0A3S9A6N3_9BACL|nr:DUF1444 family protein [Paenibacillus albus]AZN41353.1 DUF1444 family protein [Paenibacillus albus]
MSESPIFSSIAYIKSLIKEEDPNENVIELPFNDSPVQFVLNDELIFFFLYDNGTSFSYVQYRDLDETGITDIQLRTIGIDNLYSLAEENLLLHTYDQGCYALTLDGNFEASLLLLDTLWDISFLEYVSTGYAVAIPCRNVLIFCDMNSTEALQEMRELVEQAWRERDHLLTKDIFTRNRGKWVLL